MKRRHVIALSAVGLFVFVVYFGTMVPEPIGSSLAVLALLGLEIWAIMTLRDPERTRYEQLGAWNTVPSMMIAIVLGLFVLEEDSGPWFWLFFATTIVSLYWAFTSALWAAYKSQDEAAAAN